ncbi:MAG: hypothetical protein AAGU02_05410 [Lawsonibacter sp.]
MGLGVTAQSAVLERFYEDRADILPPKKVETGATVRTEWVAEEENVPCSLSRLGTQSNRVGNKSERRDVAQAIIWDAVLFLAPEWAVRPGNRVRVRQLGKAIEFEAVGRPAMYETHQEVLLREKGNA